MADIIRITDDTYRIEDGGVRFYVFLGSQKAAVIDTGMNTPNARQLAESITQLPLVLINTHADPDHISGNGSFDVIYMSPAEEENYRSHGGKGDFIPVKEGDVIDLGGRKLQVIDIPGHTPGSIALLDEANRILVSGDSVSNSNIFMFGPMRDLARYIESMHHLAEYDGRYDEIYPMHGDFPRAPGLVAELTECATRILEGKATGTEVDMFGNKVLLYKFPCAGFLCDKGTFHLSQNVMVTGAGKAVGLGFNLVLRYLEAGDTVVATIRKPCPELDELKEKYGKKLIILTMDISSTESVQAAADELSGQLDSLDLLINNAVSVSPDCDKGFFDANLDYIARTVDIAAVGPMRVIKAFYPLLKKSTKTALIMNISSEAGSISKCYRTNMIDYGMAKAALNMATMNLVNTFKGDRSINIFCVHPGWIRTDGRPDNPAPLSSYEAAEILRELFEKKRTDFEGHRFITNLNEDYPF